MLTELLLTALVSLQGGTPDESLRTMAEASGFRATSTSAQVEELLARIAERSKVMHVGELARSTKGKALPFVVLADPPVRTAEEARASGKPIVFAFGNIHAGEVCGKEALLMLVRELATTPDHPLLDELVLLVAPNYNPDGNDEMDPNNRRGQVGPEEGMGQRANGQGLDLNRDWIKLDAPETRGFVRVLNEWDPHVVIDTHTTNGSEHRYTFTFAAPQNPSGFAPSIEFVRDELLPTVSARVLESSGYDSISYGNFNRDQTVWSTYSANPRHGCPYRGLRGRMSILSEAYAYATYEDRVLATRAFVRAILEYVVERKTKVLELHELARTETVAAGEHPQPDDLVGLRHRMAAFPQPLTLHGWEYETGEDGRRRRTDLAQDYTVVHLGRFEPTVSVRRPYAYVLEPGLDAVVEKLRQHGVVVEPFSGEVRVESYRITTLKRARRAYQGHRTLNLDVEASDAELTLPEGSTLVRLAQPLGNLIVYLLEPRSTDGLAAWNFLDDRIEEGGVFPIHRIRRAGDLR